MEVITGRAIWVPVIVLVLTLSSYQFKWRAFYVVAFLALLFSLADQTSVLLFKNVFERLRPCHNATITDIVHTINNHCGGKFGFVSSHASNSFALAVFSGLLLRKYYRFIFPALVFWAALVSYSRIYVGVHYPGDILGGAILGSVIAIFVYHLMKYVNMRFNLKIENI